MMICVKLFAAAREEAGVDEITVNVSDDATVNDVRRALIEWLPAVADLLGHAMFAVNQEYAGDSVSLKEDDEVALIPPVSGG